jgi:hypothetical protein
MVGRLTTVDDPRALTLTEDANHHPSHRGLLTDADGTGERRVDAIIVPSARAATNLSHAAGLAKALDCTLLVLCSKDSVAASVDTVLRDFRIDFQAVDVTDDLLRTHLPREFRTTRLLRGGEFERAADTSEKRNLGLLIAALAQWRTVLFLDDDIQVTDPHDVLRAATLLDDHFAVGLRIEGFPDNSVVCHAVRDTGGEQDTFIGGGALLVGERAAHSFYPKIYNEDWFYLMEAADLGLGLGLRRVGRSGRALQGRYDPYASPARATSEEFGDCLAEAVFALFDTDKDIAKVKKTYWSAFLTSRQRLIDDMLDRLGPRRNAEGQQRAMIDSLRAASTQCRALRTKPDLFRRYLVAWRADVAMWQEHVRDYRYLVTGGRVMALANVLAALRITGHGTAVDGEAKAQAKLARTLTKMLHRSNSGPAPTPSVARVGSM